MRVWFSRCMHAEMCVLIQRYVCNRADAQGFCQYSLPGHQSDSAHASMTERCCSKGGWRGGGGGGT